MSHTIIISATSRTNLELSEKIKQEAEGLDMSAEIIDIEALKLPLYSFDEEAKEIPLAARELSEKLSKVAGFVFVGPEYNGGMTPAAVNAICWISRTGGDWRKCFSQKMVLMATSSGGGGLNLLRVVNTQMQHLGAIVLPRPIIVNASKKYSDEAARAGLALIKNWSEASMREA
jgi:NAD(P)H-dependent FMN reductase